MSREAPYRVAERSAGDDASPPLPAFIEGELVVVPQGTSLPKVCIKCDAKSDLRFRPHRFAFAKQPTMGKRVMWGALLGPVGGAIATAQATEYASFTLPLCERCNARWTDARIASIASLLPMVAVTLWLFVQWSTSAPKDEMIAPALAFLASIVAVGVLHRLFIPSRIVRCFGIEGRYVKLGGVGAAAKARIVGEAAPRKKKKPRPVAREVA